MGYSNVTVTNFLLSLTVKEFWKSANTWRSYAQEYSVLFFDSQCTSCLNKESATFCSCNLSKHCPISIVLVIYRESKWALLFCYNVAKCWRFSKLSAWLPVWKFKDYIHKLHRIFTARCYASAVLASVCLSVSVSVCLCLSQVGVLLKRLNVGSHKQHHTIAQGL